MALFHLPPDVECLSWLLNAYDQSGGEAMTKGRGAPWDLRLWVAFMLHLFHRGQRRTATRLPLRRGPRYPMAAPGRVGNRRGDWHRFPEALRRVSGLTTPFGNWDVPLITVQAFPREYDPDAWIPVNQVCPPTAARGAPVDFDRLTRYGTESATLYRAYLSAVAWMDRSARQGRALTAADGEALARFNRPLTADGLARLAGLDPKANRTNRRRSLAAFERLADDGMLDLVTDGRSRFRLLGPCQPGTLAAVSDCPATVPILARAVPEQRRSSERACTATAPTRTPPPNPTAAARRPGVLQPLTREA